MLTAFRVRGILVPEVARERILAQKDPERLQRWLEKAIVAPPIAEVINELLLLGERWILRCDDAVTLLGATGGRFGVANATTLSFGARWEAVNVSAGLSLAEYSLPLCGAHWCATVRSLAPGVDTRLDVFLPGFLRGAL